MSKNRMAIIAIAAVAVFVIALIGIRVALTAALPTVLAPGGGATTKDTKSVKVLSNFGPVFLNVQDSSGNVTVVPDATGEVRVEIVKHAPTQADLDKMNVVVDNKNNLVHVTFEPSGSEEENHSVDFTVHTPPNAHPEVGTGAGNITVSNYPGSVVAHTGAGNVTLTGTQTSGGTLNTGAGNITATGIHGPLDAHSDAGNVSVEGAVSGASHISSDVGNVTVTLPPGCNLKANGRAGVGNVSNDFGLLYPGGHLGSNDTFAGTIGSGVGSLDMSTNTGNVSLKKE